MIGLRLGAALSLVLLLGCAAPRGVHTIPVTRDYAQLESSDLEEVADLVAKAQRVGAQHYAPFDYDLAVSYLDLARKCRREGDRLGHFDYTGLARSAAERAIRDGSGIEDRGASEPPATKEACRATFEAAKARYLAIDSAKAIEVAPILYAQVTFALSRCEHELNKKRQWRRAARSLAAIETDIEALSSRDLDGDGVADLQDAAPWAAEDKDGFEDGDGAPDMDNDRDGVFDEDDLAPNEAETMNRWHDDDGAPDEVPSLEAVYFATGSATFSAEARGYLRGLAELVKEWPGLVLHLQGHTDSQPSESYSLMLSRQRAESVRDYLADNGAPAAQIKVSFYGGTQPVSDNLSLNRRVDLTLE